MRGASDGMVSPFPLGLELPSVYSEDPMALSFTYALDDLLAPLLSILDCLPAYLDPALAPADFVAWLGGWVGVEVNGDEPPETLRRMVAGAAAAHRLRGTARGVSEAVRLAFGVVPEIEESGGASWLARPSGPFPGEERPRLTVRLRVPDPAAIDLDRLEQLVASARPAHVPCQVEVLLTERSE